jgi:hypothetical protein
VKSELAEELLDKLMGWDRAAFQEKVRRLEALATYKFDEYGNFRPGVKFFESLAAWLAQFEDPKDRATALDFVLDRLIFISDVEMTHLIELVYPDHIELVLRPPRRRAAWMLAVRGWRDCGRRRVQGAAPPVAGPGRIRRGPPGPVAPVGAVSLA